MELLKALRKALLRARKGIQSEKRETALRLSKMGLSIKQIAQATELSEDDVLKLIQK